MAATTSPVQLVLDNSDLVHKILTDGKFTYPELQGMQPVNKTFREVAATMYNDTYQEVKRVFNDVYHTQMGKFRKALSLQSKFCSSASLLVQINTFKLWPFLVHQPDMAENLFLMWSEFHKYAKHMPFVVRSSYAVARHDLAPYVLFEDVSFMTIQTMRQLVAFKGIRGAWSMPKRKLVQHLKRPKDHVYYWDA